MDFTRWRPWVLVIEATLPNSRVTNHQAWEHTVTAHRYHFAWFDGLNRYYVAEEHLELLAALEIQPNVFDEFISHHLDKAWAANKEVTRALRESEAHAVVAAVEAHDAHERADAALAELDELRKALAIARTEGHKVSEWARELEARLVATHASTSWKITRPLRSAGALLRALRDPGLARRVLGRISANQRLRRLVIPLLLRYPALGRRVSASLAAIRHAAPAPNAGAAAVPEELRPLPASVRAVLADLQRARANHTSTT
jgi:hypothetical protein